MEWATDREHQVALHGVDDTVAAQVRRLAELAGTELLTVPAGQEVAAALVLTGVGEPGRLRVRVDPARLAAMPDGAAAPTGIVLPGEAEVLLDLMVAVGARHRAHTVGVVGAHGGAGASVLAAALARAAAGAGSATAVVDMDPAGGGLDVLLGVEHDPGQRWTDLGPETGAILPQRLALALPEWHLVRVLSGDRRGGAPPDRVARSAVRALGQGHDVVVLDLPRQVLAAGPARDLWLRWCMDVVLLGRSGVRGGAAVLAAAPPLVAHGRAHLVMRSAAAEDGDAAELAEAAGLPLAATMRDERALAAGIEQGLTPGDQRRGHLRTAARGLVARLGLGP